MSGTNDTRAVIAELLARHFCPEYGDPAYVEEYERHGMKIPDPVDQSTMVSFIADDGHRSLSTLTFGDIADALVSHGWAPKPTVRAGQIVDWVEAGFWRPAKAGDEIRADLRECGIEVTDD